MDSFITEARYPLPKILFILRVTSHTISGTSFFCSLESHHSNSSLFFCSTCLPFFIFMGKRNAKVFNKTRCCSMAFYNSKASYSYISSSNTHTHTRARQTIISYNNEKCGNHSEFSFSSKTF